MSFLVIDATTGTTTDAAFKLSTGANGSRGILECAEGIRCIDIAGTVVYLTEDCVGGVQLPMSASQLTSYLGGRNYPLSLAGVTSYLRDCGTGHARTFAVENERPRFETRSLRAGQPGAIR
jgi:hypothetical protein